MQAVGIIGVLIYFIILIGFLGLWIYAFVLFVKLANRGIKALDIFISGNANKESTDKIINDNTNY